MAIIELLDVSKFYGMHQVLKNASCTIQEGEFFSLLGPSGCGKTTLLRVVAGFEDWNCGSLKIDGVSMENITPDRRPTNMVFQNYAVFPHLNIAQNVAFGLRAKKIAKTETSKLVAEALEKVGLGGFESRAAHQLSGGQRQRVALARAIILKPRVLLLDEPLSALDRKLREAMQSELRHLQRELGITFVMVTHDQDEAMTMSDRVAVMKDGEFVQISEPMQLYQNPGNRFVAEFFGSMNIVAATVQSRSGATITVDTAGFGKFAIAAKKLPGIMSNNIFAGIRPELLTILSDKSPRQECEKEARVVDFTYRGELTFYDVLFAGLDQPVQISMRNIAERRMQCVGDTVRVGWSKDSILLLADE